jgi:hypothetical protein
MDLRAKLTMHPIAGIVNCYERLLIMAVHPRRHALQIEETKATLADGPVERSNDRLRADPNRVTEECATGVIGESARGYGPADSK